MHIDFLTRYATAAEFILRRWFRDDCCLNATRVTIEVCAMLGVKAEPLSVSTLCMNERWLRMLERLGRVPTQEESDACVKRGGWAMGTDLRGGDDPDRWCGHLVALVEGEWMVDASFRQFARPAQGIKAPDIAIASANGLLAGEPLLIKRETAFASYAVRTGDKSYKMLRGFQRSPHSLECAEEIAAAMRRQPGRVYACDIIGRQA